MLTVPPGKPLVAERTGGLLNATRIGPKEEGDDLALTCTVRGGNYNIIFYYPYPELIKTNTLYFDFIINLTADEMQLFKLISVNKLVCYNIQ